MKLASTLCPVAGLVLTAATSAIAQDQEDTNKHKTLDHTVITTGEDAPLSNNVSAEDIKIANPSDLRTLFERSPGVLVNGGANIGQQIFVNGFESPLLNVTIDGASQGNLFHHNSSVLVEPNLLKQVEVVAGAGSALDGPGALGGAIRFETKNVFDYLPFTPGSEAGPKGPVAADYQKFGGDVRGTYFANGDGYNINPTLFGKFSPNWGLLVNAGYTDRDDYKDGNGDTVENTSYDRKSALIKLSGQSETGHKLDLGFDYFEDNALTYTRGNINSALLPPFRRGELQNLKASRATATLNYDYNPESNELVDLETNVFYTDQNYERDVTGNKSDIATFGLDLRNTFNFWRLESTVGTDFQNRVGSANYGTQYPDDNPAQDQEENVFGIYNQNILSLHKTVDFSFGARFDNYDYEDGFANSYSSSRVSPNASLIWSPIETLSIDAGYSEAYRGVGIREAYLADAVRPAGLGGEKADTLRASFSFDNQTFFAGGSIFEQNIDNYINPSPYRPPYSFDLSAQGYDLRVGFRKGGFTGSAAVAYSDPKVNGESSEPLGVVVAGRRWIADLNYAFPDNGLSLGWLLEYRESVDEVLGDGGEAAVAAKDDYFLNNIYVAWDVPRVDGLSLQLNVSNLFDELYQDHTIYSSFGLNSPGREVRLNLSYVF